MFLCKDNYGVSYLSSLKSKARSMQDILAVSGKWFKSRAGIFSRFTDWVKKKKSFKITVTPGWWLQSVTEKEVILFIVFFSFFSFFLKRYFAEWKYYFQF